MANANDNTGTKKETDAGASTATPGAGDDKSGVAGKGSDQRPASHMEQPASAGGGGGGGKK